MHFFECFEDAVGAGVDSNRRQITPLDDAVFIQNEQGSLANTLLGSIGAVQACDSAFWFEIGKQRKLQLAIFSVCEMAPDAVDADRHERCIEPAELGQQLVV